MCQVVTYVWGFRLLDFSPPILLVPLTQGLNLFITLLSVGSFSAIAMSVMRSWTSRVFGGNWRFLSQARWREPAFRVYSDFFYQFFKQCSLHVIHILEVSFSSFLPCLLHSPVVMSCNTTAKICPVEAFASRGSSVFGAYSVPPQGLCIPFKFGGTAQSSQHLGQEHGGRGNSGLRRFCHEALWTPHFSVQEKYRTQSCIWPGNRIAYWDPFQSFLGKAHSCVYV